MKGKHFNHSAAPLRDLLHGNISRVATSVVSQSAFYTIVAIATLLFALFYLVGFDRPYDENPDFNAPLLTGAVIWLMLIVTAVATVACIASGVRSIRMGGRQGRAENGVPARRIALWLTALVALALVATFALVPATPVTVNSAPYTDAFWLRTTEMLVDTSLLLLAVAVGAIVYSRTRAMKRGRDTKSRKGGAQC